MARGGPQHIPRPDTAEPGRPAPWASAPSALLRPTLEQVCTAVRAAPPARPGERREGDGRFSAVLCALYEHEGEAVVVLTRRAHHLRQHSGEVSFPGGRQDPGETLWATALREAQEEVALDPSLPTLVGELDHLRTVTSESFIVPFVAALAGVPELVPHPGEVDEVLRVPVADLLHPDAFHEEWWTMFGQRRSMAFFDIEGDTIWGATASMLRNVLSIITGTFDPADRQDPWSVPSDRRGSP